MVIVNIDELIYSVSLIWQSDYDSALFWADKMVCLSNGALQDVYNLAKSMYLCGQYHRAATLLNHYQCDRVGTKVRGGMWVVILVNAMRTEFTVGEFDNIWFGHLFVVGFRATYTSVVLRPDVFTKLESTRRPWKY
jgi:hypothetical protein